MFKWSKRRPITDPSRTPFLTSVALPEVGSPFMQTWTTQVMGQTATRSASHQRSTTTTIPPPSDYPEHTRPRSSSMRMSADQPIKGILKRTKQPEMEEKTKLSSKGPLTTSQALPENQGARPRSSSNAQAPVKGILKAPKVYPIHPDEFVKSKEKPVIPPSPELKGRPDNATEPKLLKKSSKKGGGYPHSSGSENHLENSSSHHDYPERHGHAPSHFYQPTITAPQPMRPVDPPRVPEGYHAASNGGYHHGVQPQNYGTSGYQRPMMVHQAASYPVTRSVSRSQHSQLHLPPTHGYPQTPHYGTNHHQVSPTTYHSGTHPPPVAREESRHVRRHSSRERSNSTRSHSHTRQRSDTDIYRGAAPGLDGYPEGAYEAPPKAPHISLSWPLISYQLRQHKRQPTPKIHFDLGLSPQISLKAYSHGYPGTQPLREGDCMQSASSHCDLEEMKMVCAGLERWPFTIRKSGKIRCFDVFEQIHHNLLKPLTPEEQASFSPAEIQLMHRYFEERVQNTPALDYVTRKRGLCRIDVLKSKKMFKEIVQDPSSGRWVVLTEDAPPIR